MNNIHNPAEYLPDIPEAIELYVNLLQEGYTIEEALISVNETCLLFLLELENEGNEHIQKNSNVNLPEVF